MKKLDNKQKIALAVTILILIFIHLQYKCINDDMSLIINKLKPTIWEEFYSVGYNFMNWSSRIFVNLPIHIMLHLDYRVWFVIELLLCVLIIKNMVYITTNNNKQWDFFVMGGLFFMYPFYYVIGAGWVTTTMTYLWPLAFAIISLTCIRKWLNQEEIKWYHYLGYTISIIYGGNQEQLALVLVIVFTIFCINLLFKHKNKNMNKNMNNKNSAIIVWMTIMSCGSLALHLFAPGNALRGDAEEKIFFPNYNMLSLIDKLELGFSATLYEFVFKYNPIFTTLAIFLAVVIFQKYKNNFFRLIGIIPLVGALLFGILAATIIEGWFHILTFSNRISGEGIITEINYYDWKTYVSLLIIIGVAIGLILSIYLAFGNTFKSVLALGVIIAGLGSRMAVALSPNIWASLGRTFTVMYFCCIAVTMLVLNEIDWEKLGKKKYILLALVLAMSIKSVISYFPLL